MPIKSATESYFKSISVIGNPPISTGEYDDFSDNHYNAHPTNVPFLTELDTTMHIKNQPYFVDKYNMNIPGIGRDFKDHKGTFIGGFNRFTCCVLSVITDAYEEYNKNTSTVPVTLGIKPKTSFYEHGVNDDIFN
jgi:hypothetical protein